MLNSHWFLEEDKDMAEKKIDPLAIVIGSLVFIAAYPVWKLTGGWRERRQRENEQRETEERENKEKRQREIQILEAIKTIGEYDISPDPTFDPNHCKATRGLYPEIR